MQSNLLNSIRTLRMHRLTVQNYAVLGAKSLASISAVAVCLMAASLPACATYESGESRTKTTKTVETPSERVTTTTTKEQKVEDYPN